MFTVGIYTMVSLVEYRLYKQQISPRRSNKQILNIIFLLNARVFTYVTFFFFSFAGQAFTVSR